MLVVNLDKDLPQDVGGRHALDILPACQTHGGIVTTFGTITDIVYFKNEITLRKPIGFIFDFKQYQHFHHLLNIMIFQICK